jgi:hypothetical protein
MASQRRGSIIQNDFTHLIFSDARLTPATRTPVFKDLERDPNQVSRLLSERDVLVKFLSNFDKYAERISQFFRQADRGPASAQARRRSYVGPGLPDVLIGDFLLRLISDEFHQFQMKPVFHDLFSSVVNFCLTSRPTQLGVLAKGLGEKEKLLELLVSGENSSQVMKEWIRAFDTGGPLFNSKVFTGWAKILIALCRHCDGNHSVHQQFHIWRKLQDLIARLTEVLNTSVAIPKETPKLVPLENLRKLADGDKKSSATSARRTQNPSDTSIVITPEVNDLLEYFGIAPPASERALRNALEQLQRDETMKVLRALADTFPCRPCHQTSIDGSLAEATAEDEVPVEQEEKVRSPQLFTGLFGSSLGVWRIVLSAQALKDLEQARSEGNPQHRVQLASVIICLRWGAQAISIISRLSSNNLPPATGNVSLCASPPAISTRGRNAMVSSPKRFTVVTGEFSGKWMSNLTRSLALRGSW